jgi:hypothetical protein
LTLKEEYPSCEEFSLGQEADGSVWLWGFGEYPEHSVLAGYPRQVRLKSYETADEARKAHPGMEIGPPPAKIHVELPKSPPSWFNPADAGEAWGEDDY